MIRGLLAGKVGKPLPEKIKDQTSRVAAVVKSEAASLLPSLQKQDRKPSRLAKQWQEATLLHLVGS